jgi:electron transport complex protein RnfC
MIVGSNNFWQKVYSFPRGGIAFEDPTAPHRDSYVTAFLPSLSVIPLTQPSGARAYPIVSEGDTVKEGMLIGRGHGPGSAHVHATVPGKVMRMVKWKNGAGETQEGIVINLEGGFEKLGKKEEVFPWEGTLPHDIQRTIAEFGVVEMEGKGRPVSEIISAIRMAPEPITLVVRCVFDDPWLAGEYVLCRERATHIAEGAVIVARSCRVSRIVYAISNGESALGEAFLAASLKWSIPTSVALVSSRYPQKNKRELDMVLRNYEKKEQLLLGSLYAFSPATLAAVYDAVKMRKPVLERYITVGGSAVKQPQVMKVRIGIRIVDIFSERGGFTASPKKIAFGSPLLGQQLADLDEPVSKTNYAVFAIVEEYRREKNVSCINCGECRNVCPVGLDPEELYKKSLIKKGNPASNISLNRIMECHGCGCCELVCPSRLPLSTIISSSESGVKDG